jgi:hypothetical protein
MDPTQSSWLLPDFFGLNENPSFFKIALKSVHDYGGWWPLIERRYAKQLFGSKAKGSRYA